MASSLSELSDMDFLMTTFQEIYVNGNDKERETVILKAFQSKVLLQLARAKDEHVTAKFANTKLAAVQDDVMLDSILKVELQTTRRHH